MFRLVNLRLIRPLECHAARLTPRHGEQRDVLHELIPASGPPEAKAVPKGMYVKTPGGPGRKLLKPVSAVFGDESSRRAPISGFW